MLGDDSSGSTSSASSTDEDFNRVLINVAKPATFYRESHHSFLEAMAAHMKKQRSADKVVAFLDGNTTFFAVEANKVTGAPASASVAVFQSTPIELQVPKGTVACSILVQTMVTGSGSASHRLCSTSCYGGRLVQTHRSSIDTTTAFTAFNSSSSSLPENSGHHWTIDCLQPCWRFVLTLRTNSAQSGACTMFGKCTIEFDD